MSTAKERRALKRQALQPSMNSTDISASKDAPLGSAIPEQSLMGGDGLSAKERRALKRQALQPSMNSTDISASKDAPLGSAIPQQSPMGGDGLSAKERRALKRQSLQPAVFNTTSRVESTPHDIVCRAPESKNTVPDSCWHEQRGNGGRDAACSDPSGRVGFGSAMRSGNRNEVMGKGKGKAGKGLGLAQGKGKGNTWANLPKRPKNDRELRAQLDKLPNLERVLATVACNEEKLGDDDTCHALAVVARLSKSLGYLPWADNSAEEMPEVPPGWVALTRKLADGAPYLAVRSLTKVLHALGSLGAHDASRAVLCREAFVPLLLARLGVVAYDAKRALELAGPSGKIPDGMLDPMAVASCLWALGKVFGIGGGIETALHVPPAVLESLMACFVLMAPRCNSQDLGNMVWGLARLRHQLSPSLEAALYSRACELLPPAPGAKMKAQELADLLWGLGTLSVDNNDSCSSKLVVKLVAECGRRAALSSQGLQSTDVLTPAHVIRAIWGLSRFPSLFQALYARDVSVSLGQLSKCAITAMNAEDSCVGDQELSLCLVATQRLLTSSSSDLTVLHLAETCLEIALARLHMFAPTAIARSLATAAAIGTVRVDGTEGHSCAEDLELVLLAVARVAAETSLRARELSPSIIAQVFNALAHLPFAALSSSDAEEAAAGLIKSLVTTGADEDFASFSARDLSEMAWALGRLASDTCKCLAKAASEAAASSCGGSNSVIRVLQQRFCEAIQAAESDGTKVEAQSVANFVWSLVSLSGHLERNLAGALASNGSSGDGFCCNGCLKVQEFKLREIASMLWALARLDSPLIQDTEANSSGSGSDLVGLLVAQALNCLENTDGAISDNPRTVLGETSEVMWAYAKLTQPSADISERLANITARCLNRCNSDGVANSSLVAIAWALVKLKVLDVFTAHESAPLPNLSSCLLSAVHNGTLGSIQVGLVAWAVAQWPQECDDKSDLALALVDAALVPESTRESDVAAGDAFSMKAQTIAHADYLLRSLDNCQSTEVAASKLIQQADSIVSSLNENASRYDEASLAAFVLALASKSSGADVLFQGPVLVASDKGGSDEGYAEALVTAARSAGRAAPVIRQWSRFSSTANARTGQAWPDASVVAAVVMRLPPTGDHGAIEMAIAAAASTLKAGGVLYLCGTFVEGLTSGAVWAALKTAGLRDASQCDVSQSTGGGVLVATKKKDNGIRDGSGLNAFVQTVTLTLPGGYYENCENWQVFPGLFAGGKLDVMTDFLLQHLPTPLQPSSSSSAPPLRVLDFACGSGVIARAIAASTPHVVEAVDADAVAVMAAEKNLLGHAKVELSDSFAALGDRLYHHILSNPPLHSGKALDLSVLLDLIREAPKHLEVDGSLWIVTQNGIPAGPLLAGVFGQGAVSLVSDGRFALWRAVMKSKKKRKARSSDANTADIGFEKPKKRKKEKKSR